MESRQDIEAAAAVGRKRKVCVGESEFSGSSIQLKNRRVAAEDDSASVSQNSGNLSCETVGPDNAASASCCSSNGSSETRKETSKCEDLEEATVEFYATSPVSDSFYCRERRETTSLMEAQADSGDLESTERRRTVEKMPSDAELEEFFSVAERNLQKKFIDKYNYDIVKDQPLEGRYEWVLLQVNQNQ